MKIICNDPSEKLRRFVNGLSAVCDVSFWNVGSLYSTFDAVRPDLVIVEDSALNQESFSLLREEKVDFVVVGAGVPEQIKTDRLVKVICPSAIVERTRKNLEASVGKKNVFYLESCADITNVSLEKLNMSAKIGFFSSYPASEYSDWKRISKALQEIEICGHQLKSLGHNRLPIQGYLGTIDIEEFSQFYNSCKFNLCFEGVGLLDMAIGMNYVVCEVGNGLYPHTVSDVVSDKQMDEVKIEAFNKVSNLTSLDFVSRFMGEIGQYAISGKAIEQKEEKLNEIRNNG